MTAKNQDHLIHQTLLSGDEYDDLLHRPLLNATRQIAQGLSVSSSLRTQILNDVMELWQKPPVWQIRETINEIFSDITDSDFANEVSECLLKHLVVNCNDWRGAQLARIAGQLGKKEEAANILLDLSRKEIKHQGEEDEIVPTAFALSEIGEKEKSVARLLEIATYHRHEDSVRTDAIEAIVTLDEQGPEVLHTLLELASDVETESVVRVTAARSLVKFNKSQWVIPILHAITANQDNEDNDRRRAAKSLDEAGERDLAVSILQELLHDARTHKVVASHVAQNLAELGERRIGIDFLVDAAQIGKPCIVCDGITCSCGRSIIVDKLFHLGEREATISLLVSFLQDEGFGVYDRVSFASQLAKFGEAHEATPVLWEAANLSDVPNYPPSSIKNNAIEALGKWGERTDEVLHTLLTSALNEKPRGHERWKAIEALGNFGNSSSLVMEPLAEIARTNPELSLKRSACEALWKLSESITHTLHTHS